MRIDVCDVNDNPPVFRQSIYRVDVEENSLFPHLQVQADDVDKGVNGQVRYSIVDGNRYFIVS